MNRPIHELSNCTNPMWKVKPDLLRSLFLSVAFFYFPIRQTEFLNIKGFISHVSNLFCYNCLLIYLISLGEFQVQQSHFQNLKWINHKIQYMNYFLFYRAWWIAQRYWTIVYATSWTKLPCCGYSNAFSKV